MKVLFLTLFLVIIIVVLTNQQEAHAEIIHGKNFDKVIIGVTEDFRPIYKWNSAPERIQDIDDNGKSVWVKYKLREDENNIYFDSANGSYILNKVSCTIHIKSGSGAQESIKEEIISHTIKEAVNGTDVWYVADAQNEACNMDYSINNDIVQVNAIKGDFVTEYHLDYTYGLEFIYKYNNTDPTKTNHKYGFTMTCTGSDCDEIKIDGTELIETQLTKEQVKDKKITVGNKRFDPQNEKHDYLWVIKKENNKMVADFTDSKGSLGVNQTLVVDPTFSSNNPTVDGYMIDFDNDDNCEASPSSFSKKPTSGFLAVGRRTNTEANDCDRTFLEYDISSLSASYTIIDSDFLYEMGSIIGTPNGCDYMTMSQRPSTATDSQIWSAIGSGTEVVNNNSACNTSGASKSIDLGPSYDAYIESHLDSSLTWAGLGIKSNTEGALDGSYHQSRFASEENATATPKPTLVLTYITGPLTAPTNLSAESEGRNVQFSWTAATPHSDLTAHYIGRSLDNSTWPAANKTAIGNVTSYLNTAYWRINQLYYYNITSSNSVSNATAFGSFTTDNVSSAPLNPITSTISLTSIKLNWNAPSSNGNDDITGYRIEYCITCTSWTSLVNNTNTLNYNHTGLSSAQTVKYRMAAWNGVGLGAYTANFTGVTGQATAGTANQNTGIVGDVIQINGTISITAGSPSPTLVHTKILVNGTTWQQRTENQTITVPDSIILDPYWFTFTNNNTQTFTIVTTWTNFTVGTGTINSTFTNSREYPPDYFTAVVPSEGPVNYTESRPNNGETILLKVNRDLGGSLFQVECNFRNTFEAITGDDGVWVNKTNIGYYNASLPVSSTDTIYFDCYNDNLLFSSKSYGNNTSNPLLAGIGLFDQMGGLMGAQSVVIIVIGIFAMANGKNSPQILVLGMIASGILAGLDLLVFSQPFWGLLMAASAIGLFAMKRYYF